MHIRSAIAVPTLTTCLHKAASGAWMALQGLYGRRAAHEQVLGVRHRFSERAPPAKLTFLSLRNVSVEAISKFHHLPCMQPADVMPGASPFRGGVIKLKNFFHDQAGF